MKNVLLAGVAAFAMMAFGQVASAQSFDFDLDVQGEGNLDWDFEIQENEMTTDKSGSMFEFNGGAGADGEATAQGQWTGVGGVFGEYAYGTGDAYSDTIGGDYAQSEFHAGSGGLNAGFAADANFNGDTSKMKYGSIVTAGGAGSATTGLMDGTEYNYSQVGSGSFDLDVDASGSLD